MRVVDFGLGPQARDVHEVGALDVQRRDDAARMIHDARRCSEHGFEFVARRGALGLEEDRFAVRASDGNANGVAATCRSGRSSILRVSATTFCSSPLSPSPLNEPTCGTTLWRIGAANVPFGAPLPASSSASVSRPARPAPLTAWYVETRTLPQARPRVRSARAPTHSTIAVQLATGKMRWLGADRVRIDFGHDQRARADRAGTSRCYRSRTTPPAASASRHLFALASSLEAKNTTSGRSARMRSVDAAKTGTGLPRKTIPRFAVARRVRQQRVDRDRAFVEDL